MGGPLYRAGSTKVLELSRDAASDEATKKEIQCSQPTCFNFLPTGFWSRFVMLEPVGTWAMELMHGLTGFTDIYPFGDDVDQQDPVMGLYDEMSAAGSDEADGYG